MIAGRPSQQRRRYCENTCTVNVSSAAVAGVFSFKITATMNAPPRCLRHRNLSFQNTFQPQPAL